MFWGDVKLLHVPRFSVQWVLFAAMEYVSTDARGSAPEVSSANLESASIGAHLLDVGSDSFVSGVNAFEENVRRDASEELA